MFDSIMQTFLTPRSTTEDDEGRGKRVEKDDEEMEVDEDPVAEEDAPLIVKDTARVVDEMEMHEFVEIFKQYGLIAPGSRKSTSHTHLNGINGVPTRSNGVVSSPAPTKLNGVTSMPSTERKGKPTVETPRIQASSPSTSPTPVNVGKKRKKSS